jgi:hypothetical protein
MNLRIIKSGVEIEESDYIDIQLEILSIVEASRIYRTNYTRNLSSCDLKLFIITAREGALFYRFPGITIGKLLLLILAEK